MEFNNDVCEERHRGIIGILDRQDGRLDNHGSRIDILEQNRERVDVKIANLCDKIDGLVSSIKWFGGLIFTTMFTGFIGFIFWYIQSL